MYWAILVAVNIPIYWGLGKLIFRDADEFGEAIYFWLKPDMWSALSGEFFEDLAAEFKLGVWIALCAGAVYGEHSLLMGQFPGFTS